MYNHKVIGGNATDQALLKFIGEETFYMLDENKNVKLQHIRDLTHPINSVRQELKC